MTHPQRKPRSVNRATLNPGLVPLYAADVWLASSLVLQLAATSPQGPSITLEWEVESGLRTCPTEGWFRRELAAELGRDPFVAAEAVAATVVRVTARSLAGREVGLSVTLTTPGDPTPQALSPRQGARSRCRAMLSEAAGELRDLLAPRAIVRSAEPDRTVAPPSQGASGSTPDAVLAQHPRVEAGAAPQQTDHRRVDSSIASTDAPMPGWTGTLDVWLDLSTGGVPASVSPGGSLGLRLSRESFALSLGVGVEPVAGGDVSCAGQAAVPLSFQRVQGDVAACFVRGPIAVCGVLVGRALLAYSPDLDAAGRAEGFQIGAGARFEGRWRWGRVVSLAARLDASLASPWRFTATDPRSGEPCELFNAGLGRVQASIGASFGLW